MGGPDPRLRHDLAYITPFRFSTVEQIAEWCMVSRQTAYKYRAGVVAPSPRTLRLFRLHYDGRILGPDWDGFCVKGGVLWTPEDRPVNPGQLHAFALILQLAAEVSYRDARIAPAVQAFYALP